MRLVLLLFVHCNQYQNCFPPAFKGSVMIFVMYTNISAISLYFRFRHIYQEENHPFPSSVYRYIWCPTLPPHKNPPKEGIYHAVCQLALNQCWVFGMITQTSTVSKFIVRLSFFYMGISILKNTKKNDEIELWACIFGVTSLIVTSWRVTSY